MWLNIYLNPPLGHAGLETCSIDPQINWVLCHITPNKAKLFITWHELSSVIPSSPYPQRVWQTHSHVLGLIATALHTTWHWSKDHSTACKGVKINLHISTSLIKIIVKSTFPYKYQPSSGLSSSLLIKTSCLRLKLVELNFFASFNADDQRKTYVSDVSK